MGMGTDTDRHNRHRNNIHAKATRALELIDGWAAEIPAPRPVALEQIRQLLTGPAGEVGWAALANAHRQVMPTHPGRDEFLTSRTEILARLDAKIWTAGQPVVADPFAGLDGGAF